MLGRPASLLLETGVFTRGARWVAGLLGGPPAPLPGEAARATWSCFLAYGPLPLPLAKPSALEAAGTWDLSLPPGACGELLAQASVPFWLFSGHTLGPPSGCPTLSLRLLFRHLRSSAPFPQRAHLSPATHPLTSAARLVPKCQAAAVTSLFPALLRAARHWEENPKSPPVVTTPHLLSPIWLSHLASLLSPNSFPPQGLCTGRPLSLECLHRCLLHFPPVSAPVFPCQRPNPILYSQLPMCLLSHLPRMHRKANARTAGWAYFLQQGPECVSQ